MKIYIVEPGFYQDGEFGIRIENVDIVVPKNTPNNFGGKEYYGFEPITFVPIQLKMVDISLLNPQEIAWINNYHNQCIQKVGPLLSGKGLEWLLKEASPISSS